jgi:hypothetical protein
MGLCGGKAQNIFMGFLIFPTADDKEGSTYQELRYVRKRIREMRKYLSRSTVNLVFDSGACVIRKEEKNHKVQIMSTNIARESIWNRYVYIFEPIPKKIRL